MVASPGVALLDVNVLLALLTEAHADHRMAQRWFLDNATQGWATCPFTQSGFVRIASNPAYCRPARSMNEVLQTLFRTLRHPAHEFWSASLNLEQAVARVGHRLHGPRQVTDAYLLGLALDHGGSIATFDRQFRHLLPSDSALQSAIVVVE